jgi:hypothetical protein
MFRVMTMIHVELIMFRVMTMTHVLVNKYLGTCNLIGE